MKKWLSLCLAVLFFAGMLPIAASAAEVEEEMLDGQGVAVDGGVVEIQDEEIETTTYPIVIDASTYDYDAVKDALFAHILQNNTDVTEDEALLMAQELIEKTYEINESMALSQSNRTVDEGSVEGNYYLGRIVDGEIVEDARTYTTGYDQIIPGDWVSEPTRTEHSLMVKHVVAWYGYDSYKSSAGGKYTVESEVATSLQLGWTATGGLAKTVAENFGISVTPTTTATSKLAVGFEIVANPWTKTLMRPYIYYYNDTYTGIRGFHCYNSLTGEYSYMTDEVYGQDRYLVEAAIRTWTRENVNRDVNATSPVPPTSWEW